MATDRPGRTEGNALLSDDTADKEHLLIRQIIADIDLKLADRDRRMQELRLAPWALALAGATAGAALFASGAAFMKLFP
jgi:hypothetical protein